MSYFFHTVLKNNVSQTTSGIIYISTYVSKYCKLVTKFRHLPMVKQLNEP